MMCIFSLKVSGKDDAPQPTDQALPLSTCRETGPGPFLAFAFYFPNRGVLVLQEDALTFITECPVQIILHLTACRFAGIQIQRAANWISTFNNAFDAGYPAWFVRMLLDAGNLDVGSGIGEAAVANRTGRFGHQLNQIFGSLGF